MDPLEELFPGLRETEYTLTSPEDRGYNCIAWAAGDLSRWWWPDATALGEPMMGSGSLDADALAGYLFDIEE